MGYGNYSSEAHQAIVTSRATLTREQVFKQRKSHKSMDPYGVKLRECRDSKDHPESLGIIFALDVSGSMEKIPDLIARKELPRFMSVLMGCGINHPQVLFMAFGEADLPSLQVGQFEATAELMDQWLTRCHIGLSSHESYELALYFAARHTALDCFEKRGRKGYFFMTGDEPCTDVLPDHVKSVFGDTIEKMPLAAIIKETSKTYEPFFLIPDPTRAKSVGGFWRKAFGERVITLADPGDTCPVAAGLVALGEGLVSGLDDLGKRLRDQGMPEKRAQAVLDAIRPFAAPGSGGVAAKLSRLLGAG